MHCSLAERGDRLSRPKALPGVRLRAALPHDSAGQVLMLEFRGR